MLAVTSILAVNGANSISLVNQTHLARTGTAWNQNYEEVRCGSVVRKNCQDVTAYAVGSLQEGTSANHLECGLARA